MYALPSRAGAVEAGLPGCVDARAAVELQSGGVQVKLLLYAKADVTRRHPLSLETPLVSAVKQSNAACVGALLEHGADPRQHYAGVDLITWAKQVPPAAHLRVATRTEARADVAVARWRCRRSGRGWWWTSCCSARRRATAPTPR